MKNKVLIGVIVVLTLVIAFEGYYIFTHWDKEAEPEESYTNIPGEDENNSGDNTNEDVEDYVRLVDTREENNQIVQEYEMVLNGEYQEFEIEFSYEQEANHSNSSDIVNYLNGKFNDNIVYSEIRGKPWSISYINSMFSTQNFTIFEGEDKNYLVIARYIGEDFGVFMDYNVYNDDLNYIGSISLYVGDQSIKNDLGFDSYDSIYKDIYGLETYNYSVRSKIEENAIYGLVYVCDDIYNGILEERVYTINHDELEYEVLSTYTDLVIAGSVC